MPRYTAGRPLYVETPLWSDMEPRCSDLHVGGEKRVSTGLVDARENPIFRLDPPIGFGRDSEW